MLPCVTAALKVGSRLCKGRSFLTGVVYVCFLRDPFASVLT